ncbi:relaxase/mobilization nuclease domain-containing protein [Erwinia mallotivora]|uniref:Relaxase n=1 Tax=Erwinia mallotivora TaxID=69222 RepID=A0A014M4N3_9GAMM|nr:relaxase/mobilization nuclease domain-containing protein [Erwinia mallotivora]EXU76761.1 relaxase [Erwinia mallotivora]
MKGMHRVKRGKSFEGVVKYVLKPAPHHKQNPFVIGGNMSGEQVSQLVKEFNLTKQIRTDIAKPVWHNSLRLPKGETLTNTQWFAFADDYMRQMGFSESHMRIYVLHDDAEGQHIHIVASRISLDKGKLYLGQNENLISTRIIEKLELTYGLTYTGNNKADSIKSKSKTKLSRNELQKEKREKTPVPKRILQQNLEDILSTTSDIESFLNKLSDRSIVAVPNISETGKMSGFSFEFSGIAFKASQIGKDYSWLSLSKRLNYLPERDNHFLFVSKRKFNSREKIKLINDTDTVESHEVDNALEMQPEKACIRIPPTPTPTFSHKPSDVLETNVLRWLGQIPYLGILIKLLKMRGLTLLSPKKSISVIHKGISMEITLPKTFSAVEVPEIGHKNPS